MPKVEVGYGRFHLAVPAIVGPFLGLIYVIILPLAFIILIPVTAYLALRNLLTRRQNAIETPD